MFLFTNVKGGSGTTVVSAAVALQLANKHGRCVLIDLCGDVPAALGMIEPIGPGVNDWLSPSSTADGDSLVLGATAIEGGVLVIHRGSEPVDGEPRWAALAAAVSALPMPVVIDAGNRTLDDSMFDTARQHLLVVRPCYLALRRALSARKPHAVVVMLESGRALTATDVASVIGVPIAAEIPVDPAVSRAVDAGLFTTRIPQLLDRHLPHLES